jgi:hypothetical protein
MIPKVIHFCWFGKGEMSVLHRRCIESWKKYCPDYELKLWNEENSDLDNDYCRAAIARKKWAFVSDWVRFDVLYRHGGIYLDTDLELIRSLDPLISSSRCILARESAASVATAFIASPAGNPVLGMARELFLQDLAPRKLFTSSPIVAVRALERIDAGHWEVLTEKSFYPFNPYDHANPLNARQFMYSDVDESTFGVHHYGLTASWTDRGLKRMLHKVQARLGMRPHWVVSFTPFA